MKPETEAKMIALLESIDHSLKSLEKEIRVFRERQQSEHRSRAQLADEQRNP